MLVDAAAPVPPESPPLPRRTAVRLLGIALGYFMVLLDMTVLAVAEPDLARSFHPSTAGLQWTVTAYTVTFAAALLSAGAAADRYGARRVFTVGVVTFGLGSLACAAAPNLATLVALRAALGVAAAACVPASMAMIAGLYPDPRRRARAVSVWAAVSGAAVAAGPVLGGVLVAVGGWRAVFLVNVPLAALTCLLVRANAPVPTLAPASASTGRRPAGSVVQLAAVAALALGTDAVIALGAGDVVHGAVSLAGAVVATGVLVVVDGRSSVPLLVRGPGLGPALVTGAAVNATLAGVLFVVPLVLARQAALSPLQTGLAFLPMTVPFAVNPLLTGRLVARHGPWPPLFLGLALLATGGLALAGAVHGDALDRARGFAVLLVALAALGFGTSFALPSLVALVIGVAPPGTAGRASGLFSAVRQLGASIGVALAGAFVVDAPATGLVALAGLCAVALVLLLVAARRAREAG
ncbi:MFS transporter [Luteimicrobium album]|uniref:MFS transporter n=1 Tax=Luteimicrobium album TaxID=1054550 RepID=A0ABQ6I1I4_9MICO|nr:MFS transporter [Luteimicrobium album]GMA24477.1 MFS transporter [Luteimicrobium album]